jgi:DNA-directed RNA polymerase specialized sigma24 family protein
VKAGNGADIERVWRRYFQRLVRLAGARLPGHCRRAFDEEDVALSAFKSFCDRAGRGQFPQLSDRDDLWRLLATLTIRKAASVIRHQARRKRGGGRVLGESGAFPGEMTTESCGLLAEIPSREPTPEDAARFADTVSHLIDRLEDPTLKTIALRKLEGQSAEQIGALLGTSSRTVDRKLRVIRAVWEESAG